MARSAIFILGSLLLIASTFGNGLPEFASPVASFLSNEDLVTSVRHAAIHAPKSHFKGKIVGKCVKVAGFATYTGKFKGFSSRRRMIVKMKIHMNGAVSKPGMKIGYTLTHDGKGKVVLKRVTKTTIKSKYSGVIRGYIGKKSVLGKFTGKLSIRVKGLHVASKDTGYFHYYYGTKPVVGKWSIIVKKGVVKYGIRGKFGGKKFFIKYSTTLNVLFLTAGMNPMSVKRNYGKLYLKSRGKTTVQKFDNKAVMPGLPMY